MFGIGHWELLLVAFIVLLLFGGAKLPSLMRNMGRSVTEFKRGMTTEDEKPKDGDKVEA